MHTPMGTLSPIQKVYFKIAHQCDEIHTYCRGLYFKYLFFGLCLSEKLAVPVANTKISSSTQSELNRVHNKRYHLTTAEAQYRQQVVMILNTFLGNVDRIHADYGKKLSHKPVDISNGLIFYSSYMLEILTSLLEVYQMLYAITVKTRGNYVFPLVPYVTGEQLRLQKWTPELIFSGFETVNNLTEHLISKPLIKIWLLHKDVLSTIKEHRPQFTPTCFRELTKTQTVMDQLSKRSNELQHTLQMAYCLNAVSPLHPNYKKNLVFYENIFCKTRTSTQELKQCDRKMIADYDQQVMLNRAYPPGIKSIDDVGGGSEAPPKRSGDMGGASLAPPSSAEIYSHQCANSPEIWTTKINAVSMMVKEDATKTAPLTIPKWITFDQVNIVTPFGGRGAPPKAPHNAT